MVNNAVYSGHLNSRVGLYYRSTSKSATGESSQAETLLFERWAQRIDGAGSEDAQGRPVAVTTSRFIMRWDPDIMQKNTALFVRDLDGDFEVQAITLVDARRRFIELKTVRRE